MSRYKLIVVLFLMVATTAVYLRTSGNEFVNYDDQTYVVNNSNIQSGVTPESIGWAFTTTYAANWHPVTWLSHMADCQLYGLDPRGHHLTNVVIHVFNTVLLFLLFNGMTGALWRSAFVAALFALHPLHVESVAWVAERKDVLSTFFFLTTLLAYCSFAGRRGPWRYLAALMSFALGLMAKPMLVSLPIILLLLDYWPLCRYSAQGGEVPAKPGNKKVQDAGPAKIPGLKLLVEKIPFFMLSILSSAITLYAQRAGDAVNSLEEAPLLHRIANALEAYAAYVGKTLVPIRLGVLYPLPAQYSWWEVAGAVALLGGIATGAFLLRRRFPFLLVGWLWFLTTLVPVIGLVKVGSQSMADRYAYIPIIGLFVMVSWGVAELSVRWPYRRVVLAASAAIIIAVFSVVTWRQIGYWENSEALFSHTLDVTTDNYIAHIKMGQAMNDKGQLDGAAGHCLEALRIQPAFEPGYVLLALIFTKQGRIDDAIGCYFKAVQLDPNDAMAHYNLGFALMAVKEYAGAMEHFTAAVRIDPTNDNYRTTLARVSARSNSAAR